MGFVEERRGGHPPDGRGNSGLLATLWREDALDAAFLLALIAGLAWAPFYLGANRPLPWGVNGLWFPLLTLGYELSLLVRRRPHPFALSRITVAAALFALVLTEIFLQLVILPTRWVHPIWAMASEALGHPLVASVSVNRAATFIALARLLTNASVFWLSLQLCRRARAADALLWSVSLIVAAYAAYGLILTSFFGGVIPFFDVARAPGSVRATFVGRNNFATFAGVGLIVTISLIISLYGQRASEGAEPIALRLRRFLATTAGHGGLLLAVSFLIFAALVGSASRGGLAATLIGLLTLLALSAARGRRHGTAPIGTIVLIGAALAGAFVFFGDVVADRLASDVGDPQRVSVYAIVVRAIIDAPWFGFGYGTFADVFPMYRDQSTDQVVIWDKAHNTYLEIGQDLGLLFGAALIAAPALLAMKCFRGAIERRREAAPALAASAASVLVGVHALVDFSLQIQAVALTFLALLGAGVAQSESSRQATSDCK